MNNKIIKLESKLEPPVIPQNWNYDASVKKSRQSIYKWKELDDELAIELYRARQILSAKPEERERLASGAFAPMDKTWEQYCKDIGIDKSTINRLLARRFGQKKLPSVNTPPLPPGKYAEFLEMPIIV